MMTSKQILKEAERIQDTKRADYTQDKGSQFQNFERSAQIVTWFDNPIDQVFVALIATKLARLAALLEEGHSSPNNESIQDTFVDLTNYCALWGGKRLSEKIGPQEPHYETTENCPIPGVSYQKHKDFNPATFSDKPPSSRHTHDYTCYRNGLLICDFSGR